MYAAKKDDVITFINADEMKVYEEQGYEIIKFEEVKVDDIEAEIEIAKEETTHSEGPFYPVNDDTGEVVESGEVVG